MDVVADAGAKARLHPADLPLLLQEKLELLAEREEAGATDAELAELVGGFRQLQGW